MTERAEVISVLREQPDLGVALEPARAASAARYALARVTSLPKAEFSPKEVIPAQSGTLGMLILEGLLLRAASVENRPTLDIFGPGDVVRPGEADDSDDFAIVPARIGWWALKPAKLAVLDAAFIRRMADYPEVIADLAGRLWAGSSASRLRLSIVQQPRLTARLHYTLWHLADHFGEVKPEGVILPLPLCHGLLAWLVGARRPAVSRALKELEGANLVARRSDAGWWLGSPPEWTIDRSLETQPVAV